MVTEVDEQRGRGGPWGPWATLFLGLVVGLVFFVVQNVAALVVAVVAEVESTADGDLVAAATLASAPVCLFVVWFFVEVRRGGPPARRYLALERVRARTVLAWVGIAFAVLLLMDLVTVLVDREITAEFMNRTYETADVAVLFWLAMVVAAPAFEEVFFRGFLFTGLADSRLGPWGAVGVTAAIFAVVHQQYDAFQMSLVFGLGLALGLARLRTGSVWPPLAMHAFVNLVATIETAYLGT